MANNETTRGAARAALEAYQAAFRADGQEGNGDQSDLSDLLVDLAHLADTFDGEEETSGAYELERALDIYHEEDEDEDPDVNDRNAR